jgi:hypothetical protein
MHEAAPGGDEHQFVFRLGEQPLGLGQLRPLHFVVNRSAQEPEELAVEWPPRNTHGCRDFRRRKIRTRAGLNEPQGFPHVQVRDGQQVATRPHGDAEGWHQRGRRHWQPTLHRVVEQSGRLMTDAHSVDGDTRERGRCQLAQHVVVTDCHHGHVVGHGQSADPTGFEYLHGPHVGGDHADRPGKAGQPGKDRLTVIAVC